MQFIKENIDSNNSKGCWNWKKSVTSAGYGQFTLNKKYWTTHRYVYTKCKGEIPKGFVIRHICHNTKCCNPDHLCVGTNRDNYFDSIEKHRKAAEKKRKKWIIKDKEYNALREAAVATKLSQSIIIKYIDPETRIFNIEEYVKNVIKSHRWKPKV